MVVKYIDSNYIIDTLSKKDWEEVENPDFYIIMASQRIKTLITNTEAGNPNDINSYKQEQQDAIKFATAKYTFWYFDTNNDYSSGSVSVNFGGMSMSESKNYNGEMVLPEVFDILKQANLLQTTKTYSILDLYTNDQDLDKDWKTKIEQELDVQEDNNIRQDGEIRELQSQINGGRLDYTGISPIIIDAIKRTIRIDFREFNSQNADVLTKEQVYSAIYASGIVYQSNLIYKKDWIVQIVDELNKLRWFIALKDSQGINPLTSPDKDEYWKEVEAQDIDLNIVVEQLKPFIDANLGVLVPKEIEAQLDTLPTANYIQETKYQLIGFESESDKQTYEQATGAQLTPYTPQFINDISQNTSDIENNSNNLAQLAEKVQKLEEYAKTGIIQFVIWNQNGYKIRLIPIQTPPSLIGRENELLDRIHVSTTTTQSPTTNQCYQEFRDGEYVEIRNPKMNEDIEVSSLNTSFFRDNNITMNLYTWWDLNQNLITTLNGDWSPKRIMPISSRYDRAGITLYLIYKAK